MAKPTDSRVLWTLSLTGGLLTTSRLSNVGLLIYIWAWVTSWGHPIGEPPNFVIMFDDANEVVPVHTKFNLLLAFAAGIAAVYFVSTRLMPSFLESTRTSSGLPKKGFLYGLLCGLASCILLTLLGTVVGLMLDLLKNDVPVNLLLFGPLTASAIAIYVVGVPVAFIGVIFGSITELILRRMYGTAEPPEARG